MFFRSTVSLKLIPIPHHFDVRWINSYNFPRWPLRSYQFELNRASLSAMHIVDAVGPWSRPSSESVHHSLLLCVSAANSFWLSPSQRNGHWVIDLSARGWGRPQPLSDWRGAEMSPACLQTRQGCGAIPTPEPHEIRPGLDSSWGHTLLSSLLYPVLLPTPLQVSPESPLSTSRIIITTISESASRELDLRQFGLKIGTHLLK